MLNKRQAPPYNGVRTKDKKIAITTTGPSFHSSRENLSSEMCAFVVRI